MGKISLSKIILPFFLMSFLCGGYVEAQMTRNQLLKKFFKITQLQEKGDYSGAIALCEEISSMYPKLPEPYLRMAQIYDEAGEGSVALVMYEQYASLELDDKALEEYLPRIKELQTLYNIPEEAVKSKFEVTIHDTLDSDPMSLAMTAVTDTLAVSELSELHVDDLSAPDDSIILPTFVRMPKDSVILRNSPLWAMKIGDIFSNYGLERELPVIQFPKAVDNLTSKIMEGKWVSSIEDENNGREYLLVNIMSHGAAIDATLDGNSGIFHNNMDVLTASWKAIQSIWSPVSRHFDINELKDNTVSSSIKDGQISFDFDFKIKKKTDYAKLSKNIVSFVTIFIPFGDLASKLSDRIISYIDEKHSETSYQTVLTLNMKAKTDNVMDCAFIITEKQTNNGKRKDILIDRKNFQLYRCPDNHKYFNHTSAYEGSQNCKSIYKKLVSESANDIDLYFPIAYMNYYGVGVNRSLVQAIGKMQTLARKGECNRARYWLASVCYNLSLDEDHYPMRAQRQQLRNISNNMISRMSASNYKYVYGMQGDIYSEGNENIGNAVSCYEQGISLGDPYCSYQLGLLCLTGQLAGGTPEKAYSYFKESASHGFPDAYVQLAICHKGGIGVKQDYAQYISMLYEGISQGSINAVKELYNAYFTGEGVGCNIEKAFEIKEIYYRIKDDIWKWILLQYGISVADAS